MTDHSNGSYDRHFPKGSQLPMVANSQNLAVYDPYTWPGPSRDEFDFRLIWHIIRRYQWLIFSVVAASVVTTMILTLMMRPVYRATALIELQPNSAVMSFESLARTRRETQEFRSTQMNILRSEAVTQRAISKLALTQDPELNGEVRQRGIEEGVRAFKSLVLDVLSRASEDVPLLASSLAPHEAAAASNESDESQNAEEAIDDRALLNRYQQRLEVTRVEESDLLRVSFESFSPEKAAKVANHHAWEYIKFNDERRFNSTSSAKEYLKKQIEQAQADLEASEHALTDFARENNIVDVEDRGNVMQTSFEDLSRSLTEVRQNRIIAEIELQQAQKSPLESLPSVLDSRMIENLQTQYVDLRAEYMQKSQMFKDNYPAMQQLKSKIDNVRSMLDDERGKLVASLRNRYEQLATQEEELGKELEAQRSSLLDLKERAISFNILKREWEANRELYAGLLDRQKDFGVASGMEFSNASVVDTAAVPKQKHKPNTVLNITMASGFGLFGGMGLALLLGFLDNTFKTREELEQTLGMPFMGIVPTLHPGEEKQLVPLSLISAYQPANAIAEAIRSIRTGMLFSRPERVPKKILLTSTVGGEGKSTIALNLAMTLAQGGSEVLIIDADLRKPSICPWLDIESSPGLAEYLAGGEGDIVKSTTYENLYVAPAGKYCTRPTDLVGSTRMTNYLNTVSQRFDFVIIDGPPCLGLADSMLLSVKVDGTLLVVRANSTEKRIVAETVNRLRMVNAPLIGSILNGVDLKQPEYGQYRAYYGYDDRTTRQDVAPRNDFSV